ncbi:methyltransferase domain-containing protein [Spirillospora sp. NPDC029432]|uniref:methyltransferase domain-containing protein n=1 Tax=Spirillospora sp. NPDC029432 TaxID=3154599 RepID=UPI00345627FC
MAARCVRGLESLLATEILRHELGTITRIGHREVHFRTGLPPAEATALRTADDVFRLVAQVPDPGPAKSGLPGLAALAANPGLDLGDGDGGRAVAGVEVSASFLGRRNFNRHDAEDAMGRALSERLGVPYHSRRDGSAPPPGYGAFRLALDGARAGLMLRVADRPLHRRAYKRRTIPGTLHPPVAAAMAVLAEIRPGHTVLDPCCGAGTPLIEAALLQPGARCRGFDIAREAVDASRANAEGLGIEFRRGDATALPLPDGSVDRVVSNPPWGRQVGRHGHLPGWWREVRRVLAPGGAAVVLTPDPADLTAAIRTGLAPVHLQQVRVSGTHSSLVRLNREA